MNRDGGFTDQARGLRSAIRSSDSQASAIFYIGFRLARTVNQAPGRVALASTLLVTGFEGAMEMSTSSAHARAPRPGLAVLPSVGVFLLSSTVLVAHALAFFPLHLDDPYITFRYGRHLARGHGLVWNVGEPPVEGFTSFGWVVLSALAERLAVSPLLVAKLVGLASVLLVLAVVSFGARRLLPSATDRLCAALLLAVSTELVSMSVSGMENVTFAATAAFLLPLLGPWDAASPAVSRGRAVLGGLACAALVLLRPEGHVFAVVLLASLAAGTRATGDRRPLVASALVLAAVLVPFHAYRLLTFGSFLPLTYLAKHTGEPLAVRIASGLRWLGTAGGSLLPVFFLALLASLALLRGRAARASAAILVAFLGYSVAVGGDTGAFPGARLLLPALPFAAVLAVSAVRRSTGEGWRGGALSGILVAFFALSEVPRFVELRRGIALQKPEGAKPELAREAFDHVAALLDPTPLRLSTYLVLATPPGEKIAVPWAGRVPYETGLPTIDMLGLNDAHIARLPKTDRGIDVKYDPGYVLSRKPWFVCENFVLRGVPLDVLGRLDDAQLARLGAFRAGQRALLRSPVLARDYEVDAGIPNSVGGSITCFRRRVDPG